MAAWKINHLGCHYPWHPGQFPPAKDIRCQWRRCRRSLTPQDLKIHRSEAEIWFRCHRSRVPGPNKRGWVDFLREIGKRLTTILGDPRETSFLLQRISVTLQRYNAIAFPGSFHEVSGLTDWGLKGRVVLLGSIFWISRDHLYLGKNIIISIIIIIIARGPDEKSSLLNENNNKILYDLNFKFKL